MASQRCGCGVAVSLGLFLWLAGCSERDPLPPLGPSTGTARPLGGGISKPADKEPDAGPGSSSGVDPLAVECVPIVPGASGGPITTPSDFTPSDVAATWSPDCSDPTLLLALAEGGCPDGSGHELLLSIRAAAVGDTLLPGVNPITDLLLSQIAIRYTRPSTEIPSGQWGTCGDASGLIEVISLNPEAPGTVNVRLDVQLTDCTSSASPPQRIQGRFETLLRRGSKTACPER